MSTDSWTWSLDRLIPSDVTAGCQLLAEVLDQMRATDWQQHDVFSVHLALEEALVNAIKHGNRGDLSKKVRVVCRLSQERIWIEITDEGGGFDPDEVPDPTDEARLECPNGRGIMLMRCYMSRVEYNAAGNRVVMEKVRENAS